MGTVYLPSQLARFLIRFIIIDSIPLKSYNIYL